MAESRLEFFDPLYETITFEKGLPRGGGFRLGEEEEPLDPKEIVQTAEFARLAQLRQVGLAWLAFPSATHTRFSHSIGCWWLGRIAETLLRVRDGSSMVTLHKWLNRASLREEYYLSLLLHDIGHGPLSHVLERNATFVSALKRGGLATTDHEERGAQLLLGAGPLLKAWDEVREATYGADARSFAEVRSALESLQSVSLPAVGYLMTGDDKYLSDCRPEHQRPLLAVKELVSGLLDLDRLDHYARDSYFSGLRHIAINIRGFLSNLRLEPRDNGALLLLTDEGAAYAASMLFAKRQILSTMFRNPQTLSYHAMINCALTEYLRSVPEGEQARIALRICWLTDDALMDLLGSSSSERARHLIRRIRSLRPYAQVAKFEKADFKATANAESLEAVIQSLCAAGHETVAHTDDHFWSDTRGRPSKDWLDSASLLVEDTRVPLTEHSEHRGDFAHLREERTRSLFVFVDSEALAETAHGALRPLLRATGRR